MENTCLVSILINNYNYERFLNQAIDSALNQNYDNIEVIVVDDGSTDESNKIIDAYEDQIIAVKKENGGQASAFNAGFAASRGDIICFLDADDLFLPEKIERIVNIFSSHPDIGWLFHPLHLTGVQDILHEQQKYTGCSGVYDIKFPMRRGKLNGYLPFAGTATSGLCFSRSFLQQLLPMPEEIKITSDDYLKFAALGLSKGFILLQELSIQRIHGNNAYTLRKDKLALKSNITMLTAYHLKTNFPSLSKFSNNLFALGLYKYQTLKESVRDCQKLISNYFDLLTSLEKLEIYLRAFYWHLKQSIFS